jgi:threonylcarbamoyladenosine tRNA methylthiotransferase CDKAL1
MASVYLETYGCTLNQSESEDMMNQLEGHSVAESAHDAQIIVLNTCMVIESTERKILKRIGALYKQLGDRKLIISGCMVGPLGDRLQANYPELEVVPSDRVVSYIDAHFAREPAVSPRFNLTAKVKIAQGCRGSCSYCIVRLIKGPIVSRSIEAVTRDVEHRVQHGAKQVFLTAQDVGACGLDSGFRLPDLIEALCELEHEFKLRIGMMNVSSIHDIVEDLVRVFKHPKVYKFVHLPVQSGSDRVLKRMERDYTVSDFKRIVARFRHANRDITLSTDFIVGFPTETEEDFRATMQLLRAVRPLKVNITRFSQRKGTPAFVLEPVTSRVTKERSRMLTAEHHRIAYRQNCKSLGKIYGALAVERGKNGSTILYTDSYRPIVVAHELTLGTRYAVLVTRTTPTYLVGTLS